MMVSWRSWLARLLNNSVCSDSLGLTEEVAGSNRQKSFFAPKKNPKKTPPFAAVKAACFIFFLACRLAKLKIEG